MNQIKFMKHYVTDGQQKTRVWYSHSDAARTYDGRECVTIYAKDYKRGCLGMLNAIGLSVKNDSDSQTDYFEQDSVRIFADHPKYTEVLARCR